MPFGFSTSTTSFSNTVHNSVQRAVVDTLRAGLVALPRGAVIPADLGPMRGENFTLIATEYPDLLTSAVQTPLSEGVPPAAKNLGVSTNSFTAQQIGIVTNVTDVAAFQSPHNLGAIAPGKVARAVTQKMDDLAIAALAAVGVDKEYTGLVLGTGAILDAVGEMAARNVSPIPGVGYYAIGHPYAFRGLKGEQNLNGYTDVVSHNAEQASSLSTGVVAQYRGVSVLESAQLTGALSAAARTGPTSTNGSATLTLSAHGLNNGVRIQFSSITGGGSNIVISTDYWVKNVTSTTFEIAATKGGTSIVQNTANMTATTFKSEQFPVYILGKGSMLAGDVSTFQYFTVDAPDSANPLAQFKTVGAKGIFGAKVAQFAETTDGAGSNGAAVNRILTLTVMSGETF